MKTIILSALSLIFSTTISAQEEFTPRAKGTYFANGTVLVNHTTHNVNDEKSNAFSIGFNPKIGYFINDNLAIGAEIALRSTNETTDDILGETETNSFMVGFLPLARYYLNSGLFGEVAAGISTQNTKMDNGIIETDYSSFGYGFRAGIGYALPIGKQVAIEPTVNYSWEKFNPEDAPDKYDETLSSIFLGIGLTAFF